MVDFWSKKLLIKPNEKAINFMVAGLGKVLVSNDGLNWWIENRSMPAFWSGALGYGFGKFYNTTPGKAYYSEDGRNWTQFTLPSSYSANKFTYAGDKMFIYGPHGYLDSTTYTELNVTTDGVNWYQEDLPIASAWKDIAYNGNGKYIAVGGEYSPYISTGSYSRGAINNGSGWVQVNALNSLYTVNVSRYYKIPVGAGHYNGKWYVVCREDSSGNKGGIVYWNNTSTALTVESFNSLNIESCSFIPGQIAVVSGNGGYLLAPGNSMGKSYKNMVAGMGSQNNGYEEYSVNNGYNMRISYSVGDKRWYRISINESTGLVQIDRTTSSNLPVSSSMWQSCKMPSNISEFSSYGSAVVGRDILIGE